MASKRSYGRNGALQIMDGSCSCGRCGNCSSAYNHNVTLASWSSRGSRCGFSSAGSFSSTCGWCGGCSWCKRPVAWNAWLARYAWLTWNSWLAWGTWDYCPAFTKGAAPLLPFQQSPRWLLHPHFWQRDSCRAANSCRGQGVRDSAWQACLR